VLKIDPCQRVCSHAASSQLVGCAPRQGDWLWGIKDHIDRSFMRKYGAELPQMEAGPAAAVAAATTPEALAAVAGAAMRCGGCAAKVPCAVHGCQIGTRFPILHANRTMCILLVQ
jgi:hypothetical protein